MKKISNVIIIILCVGLCYSIQAYATSPTSTSIVQSQELNLMSEPYLYECGLELGPLKEGMAFTLTTFCSGDAEEIGCENVVLQEKQILGFKEITVNTSASYDTNFYVGGAVYSNAVPGKSYRLKGTHYAIIDGVKYSANNISDWVVFN